MDLLEELKSFDNVISAIDFLYLNLKERENNVDFDLNRLRMIGIEACDRESNTYLWHINALIHASSDLEHLILGLGIMFDRYLKSKIEDSINTSMENMNKMGKMCTVNEISRRNKMDSDGDSIEDESYFVQLKSRSGSGSPNKSQKKWMHGDNNNNNTNNNNNNNNSVDKIEKHCVIEPCYNATKIMENMISIGNNSKTGKTNKIKTGKMGMGNQIIDEQENEESNEIRKNDSNFLSVRISSTSNASNTANTANTGSAASSEKENDKSSVDYIAQLLLSPDGGRKKHVNTIKGQSSPNARRMKRIKRIRQQQRSCQHSYQRDYEHNYQHNYPENLVSIDEMNGLNDDKVQINDKNDANGTTTGARQLSPFEIGKFVRQVDKLQN